MNIRLLQIGDTVDGHTITHLVDSNSGFGNIYRAHHHKLDADHAIKQLRPDRTTYRQAFLDEARRAKKINDPHVINIHNLIEAHSDYGDMIVMEWLEGETLLQWRYHHHNTQLEILISIAQGIAQGLAAVHKHFSHNDIKPDNIMIRGDLHPVLIDFGLAYHDNDSQKHPVLNGAKTAAFAAPEVLQNKPLQNDGRLLSDIFSLGVVFYYLFTGRHYLNMSISDIARQANTQFILDNLAHQKPQPLLNYPQALNHLIMQMLDPIPAQRPPSLKSIIEQLRVITSQQKNIVKIEQQRSLSLVPQLYVGVLDDLKITTQTIPMQAVSTTTGRLLYQIPIAASPITNQLMIAVQYNQKIYTTYLNHPQKHLPLYFGEDAQGNIQLRYNDTILPIIDTPPQIPGTVQLNRQCKTQLALILDGRLTGEALEIATYILRSIAQAAEADYELEIAVILYGAYPDLVDTGKSSWRSPYFLQARDFSSYAEAMRFASYYLFDNVPDFSGIGYSGSLEVALHHTLHQLSWHPQNAHYSLILGHAPPYPTAEERRLYELFEFSIDEFKVQTKVKAWRNALEQMKRTGIIINAGYIDPPYGVSHNYRQFMEEAWRWLDSGHEFYYLQDAFSVENFCKDVTHNLQRIKRVIEQPEQPYPLPLMKRTP